MRDLSVVDRQTEPDQASSELVPTPHNPAYWRDLERPFTIDKGELRPMHLNPVGITGFTAF